MKNFLLATLLLLCFAGVALAQDKESLRDKRRLDSAMNETKPQLYELRCRGGIVRGLNNQERNFHQVAERTTSSGDVVYTLTTTLSQNGLAAGTDSSGLSEGACAFVDRPINDAEFSKYSGGGIRFETPANAQLKQKQHGSAVDTSPTAAERYPDAQTIPGYMKNPKNYWSFFGVFKGDYFQASHHQHWKKPPPPPRPYDTKPRGLDPKMFTKP